MLQQIIFVFGTLGTTVYTADHAKHQPIAVVTLKVKDNAPDGAQAINLTTFNGVDANLDKVGGNNEFYKCYYWRSSSSNSYSCSCSNSYNCTG